MKPWYATDARLFWKVSRPEQTDLNTLEATRPAAFEVRGFQRKLRCAAFARTYSDKENASGVISSAFESLGDSK